MLHFSDNETSESGDRLAKIQPLIDMLQKNFQSLFCPEEDAVIDETLVPWRGRLTSGNTSQTKRIAKESNFSNFAQWLGIHGL